MELLRIVHFETDHKAGQNDEESHEWQIHTPISEEKLSSDTPKPFFARQELPTSVKITR